MVKNLPAMQEMRVQSLGQGRSPGEGNWNPLQYSCLENSMDRGVWWTTVYEVTKESDTTEHTVQIYTTIYKINTNEVLLYSTGNSTQYSVIT